MTTVEYSSDDGAAGDMEPSTLAADEGVPPLLSDPLWYDQADEVGDPPLSQVVMQACAMAMFVATAAGLRLLVTRGTRLVGFGRVEPGFKLPADPKVPFWTGR